MASSESRGDIRLDRLIDLESVAIVRLGEMFSIIDGISEYFHDIWFSLRSVFGSCATAFPYLVGAGEHRKEVTEQYPDPISSKTEDDLPPRSRGLLYNDIERCIGCGECERICPTNCIRIETEPGSDASKLWVSTFDIDFSNCVFCGLCTEVCQPQSLVHTKKYEGSARVVSQMVASFGRGQVTPEQQEKWALQRRQQEVEGEIS